MYISICRSCDGIVVKKKPVLEFSIYTLVGNVGYKHLWNCDNYSITVFKGNCAIIIDWVWGRYKFVAELHVYAKKNEEYVMGRR